MSLRTERRSRVSPFRLRATAIALGRMHGRTENLASHSDPHPLDCLIVSLSLGPIFLRLFVRWNDEPAEQLTFSDLPSCIAELSARFPDNLLRFVNEGVIQDEYADFVAGEASR
jgi:hypothetical protein